MPLQLMCIFVRYRLCWCCSCIQSLCRKPEGDGNTLSAWWPARPQPYSGWCSDSENESLDQSEPVKHGACQERRDCEQDDGFWWISWSVTLKILVPLSASQSYELEYNRWHRFFLGRGRGAKLDQRGEKVPWYKKSIIHLPQPEFSVWQKIK